MGLRGPGHWVTHGHSGAESCSPHDLPCKPWRALKVLVDTTLGSLPGREAEPCWQLQISPLTPWLLPSSSFLVKELKVLSPLRLQERSFKTLAKYFQEKERRWKFIEYPQNYFSATPTHREAKFERWGDVVLGYQDPLAREWGQLQWGTASQCPLFPQKLRAQCQNALCTDAKSWAEEPNKHGFSEQTRPICSPQWLSPVGNIPWAAGKCQALYSIEMQCRGRQGRRLVVMLPVHHPPIRQEINMKTNAQMWWSMLCERPVRETDRAILDRAGRAEWVSEGGDVSVVT